MTQLLLLIISRISDRILSKVFWLHGSWIALKRGELTKYWHSVAVSNDMNLNVKGKYLLNQRLSDNEVFGNPLMTVSAAKHLARSTNAGNKWKNRINKLDEDHFAKAYESYKKQITKAYNELL